MFILILIVWFLCGLLAAGLTFAYFQGEFPGLAERHRGADHFLAAVFFFVGPIGLIVTYPCSEWAKHGWRLR